MMVGNSLKSDIVPALEAGFWGVYVPHSLTWALEQGMEPTGNRRYREISHLGELIDSCAGSAHRRGHADRILPSFRPIRTWVFVRLALRAQL
jgi:hypothetical protein